MDGWICTYVPERVRAPTEPRQIPLLLFRSGRRGVARRLPDAMERYQPK
jgi:hypothetical protein